MRFRRICLWCGEPNNSRNYSCDCRKERWTDEYRSCDLELKFEDDDRKQTIQSIQNYRFDHPEGVLQYKALPNRHFAPQKLEPVGMTPLYRLDQFGEKGRGTIFIKNEGANPSGCFKDRETLMCLLQSRSQGRNRAVIYSSGNAAASAALFAQQLDFDLVTFVAGDTYDEKIDFIRDHGSDVIVIGDANTNFEEGFRLFAQMNAEGWFAHYEFDNWSVRNPYRVQGDKTTALEIIKQLNGKKPVVPDFVIVPTANGSGLAGLWKGFLEMQQLGLIDTLPRMVAAGIKNANPVAKAVQKKQTSYPEKCRLEHLDEEDFAIGSTIIAEEGYDSFEAAKAVLNSGGKAIDVRKRTIRKTMIRFLEREQQLATQQGILPEPASLVALAAARQLQKKRICKPHHTIVALISGHGLKAGHALMGLLKRRPRLQQTVAKLIRRKQQKVVETTRIPGKRIDVPADVKQLHQAFSKLKTSIV